MEKRKLTLIINPISGTMSKAGIAERIQLLLSRMGYEVQTAFTTGPGDATRIAAEAAARGDYGVIACGGDGTVNEVASGLIGSQTALGILPTGSGNGLARHIGIPIDIELSLDVIKKDFIEDCDYGEVNGHPFFCTFGLGFDAAVSKRFAQKSKRGLTSYISSMIEIFANYAPQTYEIITNDKKITDEAFLVSVCNASQFGNNAFVAPSASIRDGLLDVTIVHKGNLLTHAMSGIEMMIGTISNHGNISVFRTDNITIRRASTSVAHIDGDPTELPAELSIKCHPHELRIFTHPDKQTFTPLLTPISMMLKEWDVALRRAFRNKNLLTKI